MNKNDYIIRLERKEEYREVETLVREAFWNVYRPGCLEHYVLNQLRNDQAFVPELDFVAFIIKVACTILSWENISNILCVKHQTIRQHLHSVRTRESGI